MLLKDFTEFKKKVTKELDSIKRQFTQTPKQPDEETRPSLDTGTQLRSITKKISALEKQLKLLVFSQKSLDWSYPTDAPMEPIA